MFDNMDRVTVTRNTVDVVGQRVKERRSKSYIITYSHLSIEERFVVLCGTSEGDGGFCRKIKSIYSSSTGGIIDELVVFMWVAVMLQLLFNVTNADPPF